MKRQIILSTALATTLFFSSASALSFDFLPKMQFTTCGFFGGCESRSLETPQVTNNTGSFWDKILSAWKNPEPYQMPTQTLPPQTANAGGAFSPTILQNPTNLNTNNINSTDFGLGVQNSGNNTAQQLLSVEQILQKKSNFSDVLKKCSTGDSSCISQVTQSQKNSESSPTKDNQTPPSSEGLAGYNPEKGSFWTQNGGEESDNGAEIVYSQQQIQALQNSYSSIQAPLTVGSVSNIDFGSGSSDCSGNGIINKAANIAILDTVKFDTSRICTSFGKKITVVDAVRNCSGPSRHCFREAIDFEINSYGNRQQQALMIVSLIALGYNIGSYENNFPLHADNEKSSYWKTWSRWAHKNGRAPLPYQQPVVDALNIIGMPARSSHEFRSTYGKPSKQLMMQKAQAAIKATGNQKLINNILSGQAITS